VVEARVELARELAAVRQHLEQPLVDQLVQQDRERGDLPDQEVAVLADADQALERRRVLVQQRQVCRTAADLLDDDAQATD